MKWAPFPEAPMPTRSPERSTLTGVIGMVPA